MSPLAIIVCIALSVAFPPLAPFAAAYALACFFLRDTGERTTGNFE